MRKLARLVGYLRCRPAGWVVRAWRRRGLHRRLGFMDETRANLARPIIRGELTGANDVGTKCYVGA